MPVVDDTGEGEGRLLWLVSDDDGAADELLVPDVRRASAVCQA
ncbi:hypothetical protein [Embleya sp. NPDC050493]